MLKHVEDNEIFGLVRSDIDVHTLGVSTVAKIIQDCGYITHIADSSITQAIADIDNEKSVELLLDWIKSKKITRLGFSYRLDPEDAKISFDKVYALLKNRGMLTENGGSINQVYFSGLPISSKWVSEKYSDVPVFEGDETAVETLGRLGVPRSRIPKKVYESSVYDTNRMIFAEKLIKSGVYKEIKPSNHLGYSSFGTFKDNLKDRVESNKIEGNPPLMRAHVGPYNADQKLAIKEFNSWLKELASTGFLNIVSVGSSQLSQSDFGKDWGSRPNGGGVPINSEDDLKSIWESSRPMLVRTYAGTRDIPKLAKIYEKTINIAWHTLSFWWFNQIDGRGPYTVKENLQQHIDTLKVAAKSGKPFEPNIPHHFSFRGGDDFTYVLSSYLAAKTAKKLGVKSFVLQVMLNTPKHTWGVQDLAKARSLLKLVRELEDESFKVYLQPRAGLDYFSPDFEKAKMQLASVSAMMDDIEPDNPHSPDIIHVVSYCEGIELATPKYINESIQITSSAIKEYRKLKESGELEDMKDNRDVMRRTDYLYDEAKAVVELLEKEIDNLYEAEGLYEVFKLGIFATPFLWEGRHEFSEAVKWKTGLVNGGITVVDDNGKPIRPIDRVREALVNRTDR